MSAACLDGLFLSIGVAVVVDVGQRGELLVLIVLEPVDAALEHAGHEGDVVLLGDLQAVDDDGRRVRRATVRPSR